MCFDPSARPPFPQISGGSPADAQEVILEAGDGNRLRAWSAQSPAEAAAGVVILPDVRGLHPYYEDLALRFAEAGVDAVAVDYFGRTAGTSARGDDFEFRPHVEQTTPEGVEADARAGIEHLRSQRSRQIFTVGFCFGGRASFNQAAKQEGLSGVIGFYGRVGPREEGDREAPVLLASSYRSPVLGLFGGADAGIPQSQIDDFARALDAAGVANEIVVYPGAPHSFFDRAYRQFERECDDAWRRILAFIRSGKSGTTAE